MATHAKMIRTAGVRVCPAAQPDDTGLLGAAYAAMRINMQRPRAGT